jgi:hypothetical protein
MTLLFNELLKELTNPEIGVTMRDLQRAFSICLPMAKTKDAYEFFCYLDSENRGLIEYEALLQFYYKYLKNK